MFVTFVFQKLMSSHSEKLLELELELRSLRGLRDEVENLRGTLESVRTRLNTLEQGGRSGTGSTHTLGEDTHAHKWLQMFCQLLLSH